ncbi:MAG: N-acetylglutamate synthase-like GNAT family acetyltransferase [Planctomycetota bacterium]|jgi:N-acetylglutamate synthase-like GNAT family acetyltransferase
MTTNITTQKEAALALMEKVLRDGRPLAQEYPLIFEPDGAGRVETIEESDEVISACAWISRTLATPSADIPAAFIGSVATDLGIRGRGHGSRLLEDTLEKARAEGAALSLLWADEPEWYQARGWIPFGTENVFVIEHGNAILLPEPKGVRLATRADYGAIHDLYCTHASRTLRTKEETEALLGVPNMQIYVCEQDGEVTGYACMGRGEDLAQVIHEWGGAPTAVLPIVSQLWAKSRNQHDRIFMMVPDTEADYRAYFKFVRSEGAQGVLAMAHLGCTSAMAQTFNAALPAGVTAVATSDQTIDITGPKGTLRLTDHEILLALCPPRGDRRVVDVIEQEVGASLPNLPVSPFVWGLDSI